MNRTLIDSFLLSSCRYFSTSQKLLATASTSLEYRPTIGLEIHTQLATPTKLFSQSAALETAATNANAYVSAFDSAIPGTLPTLSKSCVEKAILAATLLQCEIADVCRFDRKHYFYPDLPLGYQITQKAKPIAKNGQLTFYAQSSDPQKTNIYQKMVRINQLQLEMDSGKMIRNGDDDLIDLNRAGLALIEIVTEPDFCTPLEVVCFFEHLRLLFNQNRICTKHDGNMRVDVNISISREGGDRPGTRTELKNIGSTAQLANAIDKELRRQLAMLERGEQIIEETRAVDAKGGTVSARAKGAQMDYRFMPEPNLPPMAIQPIWIEKSRRQAQFAPSNLRLIEQYGFPPMFTFDILKNDKLNKFVDAYLSHGLAVPFHQFYSWLNELEFLCQKLSIDFPPTNPHLIHCFAELVHLECNGRLTKLVCIDLLREFAIKNQSSEQIITSVHQFIEERQLWRIVDQEEIALLVDTVIVAQKADFVQRLLAGKNKPLAILKREVIERSQKRAEPGDLEAAIQRKIEQLGKHG